MAQIEKVPNGAGSEQPMIQVTPIAVQKIRTMLVTNHAEALRLGVVAGGCSGLSYKFKLESAARPNDQVFEYEGVKLFVDPKSLAHLDGLTLDYHESLMERGFVFKNPNAQHTCSCGKSFLT
jgi:iron-sulfur cluster assembly protein